MAGVATLRDSPILIGCAVGIYESTLCQMAIAQRNHNDPVHTNHVRAVILVVGFAHLALQTCFDLSANADAISDLYGGDLITNFDGLANDLMTNADWERAIAPAASDGVYI